MTVPTKRIVQTPEASQILVEIFQRSKEHPWESIEGRRGTHRTFPLLAYPIRVPPDALRVPVS